MKTLKLLILALLACLPARAIDYNLATESGDWSTLTWSLGHVPTGAEYAQANGFVVAVNVNASCGRVSNSTDGSATEGGQFVLAAGVTLTANVAGGNGTSINALLFGLSAPNSATIIGDLEGDSYWCAAENHTGDGTLNITGTIKSRGLRVASCAVNITGSCHAGAWDSCDALQMYGGLVTISGDAIAGTLNHTFGVGIYGGECHIRGRAIASTNGSAPGVYNDMFGTGTCTVKGIQYGPNGESPTFGCVLLESDAANACVMTKSDLTTITMTPGGGTHTTVTGTTW